jgi:cytochrome P450
LWQRKFFKRKAAAVATGPDFNQEILSDPVTWQTVSIGSGPRNSAARRVSVGLVSLQGDKHKYYRQLFIPPMSRKNIDAQSDLIGNTAVAEVERWPLNETIDLWAYSRALLQNFAITLLFGNDCARGIPVAELIHQLFSNTASRHTV